MIEKPNIERCIMNNQFAALNKIKKLLRNIGKFCFVLQEIDADAMHLLRPGVDLALRI